MKQRIGFILSITGVILLFVSKENIVSFYETISHNKDTLLPLVLVVLGFLLQTNRHNAKKSHR